VRVRTQTGYLIKKQEIIGLETQSPNSSMDNGGFLRRLLVPHLFSSHFYL